MQEMSFDGFRELEGSEVSAWSFKRSARLMLKPIRESEPIFKAFRRLSPSQKRSRSLSLTMLASPSVIEQELRGVHQGPQEVLPGPGALARRRSIHISECDLSFLLARKPPVAGQVQFLRDLPRRLLGFHQPPHPPAVVADLRLDFGGVHQVEDLSDARLVDALALAGGRAQRAPENLQKIVRQAVVPKLYGSSAFRQKRELLRPAGDLANGIQQHLGSERLERGARKVLVVLFVSRAGHARQLVDLGSGDGANELFQVKLFLNQVARQCREERPVACGIRLSQVIHRLNQPAAKEGSPDSIGDGAGKPAILGGGHPVSQGSPGVIQG